MLKKIILPAIILILALTAYGFMTKTDQPKQAKVTQAPAAQPASAAASSEENSNAETKPKEQASKPRGMGMRPGVLAKQGATSVITIPVATQIQPGELKLFGTMAANQYTTIKATSTATVSSIDVLEGDLIKAGQTIVTLKSDTATETLQQRTFALNELDAKIKNEQLTYKNNLASLEINKELLRIAKNSVDRFSSLNSQQLSSGSDYEAALRTYQTELQTVQSRELSIAQYDNLQHQLSAQREVLQSQIRQAKEIVGDLKVSSSFDGLVAKISVTIDQEIATGDTIAEVYNPASLQLLARVPMRYRLDQLPLAGIQAFDELGQQWQAVAIRPVNESGAQRIQLTSVNPSTYLPGSHVTLTLHYPINRPTVSIPESSVYDQQRIYLANNGIITAKPVKILGRSNNNYLIDAEGFASADQIITTRLKNPISGMPVAVVKSNQGAQ